MLEVNCHDITPYCYQVLLCRGGCVVLSNLLHISIFFEKDTVSENEYHTPNKSIEIGSL